MRTVHGDEGRAVKANLDLPYNASGSAEEDEEAPDIVLLYGATYETNALVICMDASLTMDIGNRFEAEKREVQRALSELSWDTEFGVIAYGGTVELFRRSLVRASKENKQAANGFVGSRVTSLGTCLGDAVVKALKMLRRADSKHQTVLLISDGTPTPCPFKPSADCEKRKAVVQGVLSQIETANTTRIRIHTVFIGEQDRCGLARDFTRSLAETSGGTFRSVRR